MSLSPRTIRALSAEADVAPATVQRRLDGKPLRPSTAQRIERAAKHLGIKLPRLASPPAWGSTSTAADATSSEASTPARSAKP